MHLSPHSQTYEITQYRKKPKHHLKDIQTKWHINKKTQNKTNICKKYKILLAVFTKKSYVKKEKS